MLSYEEYDRIRRLHNAGKGGVEISRIIENRRIESTKCNNADVLTEVFEVLFIIMEQ